MLVPPNGGRHVKRHFCGNTVALDIAGKPCSHTLVLGLSRHGNKHVCMTAWRQWTYPSLMGTDMAMLLCGGTRRQKVQS